MSVAAVAVIVVVLTDAVSQGMIRQQLWYDPAIGGQVTLTFGIGPWDATMMSKLYGLVYTIGSIYFVKFKL